jgi:hypothetical protein
MAKTSGLGGALLVDDSSGSARDISNDCTNWSFTTPRATQDVTGLDKFANERILLLADCTVTLNGVFNTASNKSHDVLKTVPSTSVPRTVEFDPVGTATGAPVLTSEQLITDYQITRSNTGELTWQAPGSLSDGTVPTWSTHA